MTAEPLFRLGELRYPANQLSLLRLLLAPLVAFLALWPARKRAALVALSGSMLTDLVDGPLARRRGEVSQLGMLLDPLADKLTIDGMALALSIRGRFPWWATALLIGRDLVIAAGATVVARNNLGITPPNMSGKATTLAFTGTLLAYAWGGERQGQRMLVLALLPFLASCISYGRALAGALNQLTTRNA